MKHPPKIFYRIKTVNFMKNILVMSSSLPLLLFFIMTQSIHIPESPSINTIRLTHAKKNRKNYLLILNLILFCLR